MGPEGLALCGMDDAGEMSSWYVLNAIGLYTYSPADPEYIVTVPLSTVRRWRSATDTVGRSAVRARGAGSNRSPAAESLSRGGSSPTMRWARASW